jgi:molybdopterin molybdotransferase
MRTPGKLVMSESNPVSSFFDVRMRGFRDRADVEEVRQFLSARVQPLPPESVNIDDAAGRVLAADVVSEVAVPAFNRAAMDGYALRGEETFGAGPYNALEFEVIGEALPARPFFGSIRPAQAIRIMTGAPLPEGANAVLQAEAAHEHEGRLRITDAVPPARNVGHVAEDIKPGETILKAGRVLRPQDLGVLASIGAASVGVVRRPSVALIVTGNELLPLGARPELYRTIDSNSVMLRALARRDGAVPDPARLVSDDRDALRQALAQIVADVLLVSGGSSVGKEDHAPKLLAELGELKFHGMALRPASPAGIGFLEERPVFLLPGNPVSCLCAYDLFAGLAIRKLGGRSMAWPYPVRKLSLARKIASAVGRVDYVRVQVREGQLEPLATSGASILSSTSRADGFVLVPRDSEGYAPGETIQVFLYDQEGDAAFA